MRKDGGNNVITDDRDSLSDKKEGTGHYLKQKTAEGESTMAWSSVELSRCIR